MRKCLFLMCFSLFFSINTAIADYAIQQPLVCTPATWPISDSTLFINQFEEAAYCHCAASGFSYEYCKKTLTMRGIYLRLLDIYHSKENSCNAQKDISVDLCVKEWNAYCGYKPEICKPK